MSFLILVAVLPGWRYVIAPWGVVPPYRLLWHQEPLRSMSQAQCLPVPSVQPLGPAQISSCSKYPRYLSRVSARLSDSTSSSRRTTDGVSHLQRVGCGFTVELG